MDPPLGWRSAAARLDARVLVAPTRVALIAGDAVLTYAELDERIDALAAHLAASGAGVGARVGLALDRTSHLVTSLWACLRLGATYVPLDPGYPRARLEHMMGDAAIDLLVADDVGRAALGGRVPVLDPSRLASGATGPSHPRARAGAAPDDLAYVIYTSGSTGRPKGVQIDQGNLAHFLDAMGAAMRPPAGRDAAPVLLASTSLSFDPSVVELVWALVEGWTVVLAPSLAGPAEHRASLGTLIERHRVTHVQLTPSRALVLLADDDERRALGGVAQILVGGEVLTPSLAADLREAGVGVVTNLYGPTESTVWAFAHDVVGEPAAVRAGGPVPLGRSLPGYPHRIVDAGDATVADGVVGELVIGGGGVSRGYRNRADLHAGRFVDDPVLGRSYRTGDLARTTDGVVHFVGRTDDQVKIGGYRIEPAEVERALAGAPGTAQVVVAARGVPQARLVAYVVPGVDARGADRADRADVLDVLRRHGAAQLPGYMLPTAVVVLEAFELTPSGKVDRSRLPDPGLPVGPADGGTVAAAADDVDQVRAALAGWWAELLGRRRVRSDEDFFDLGGDSTLAVRLLARVQRAWGVRLGLATLVSASTVETLAAVVVAAHAGAADAALPDAGSCLVPFPVAAAVAERTPLVVVHGAGGNVLNLTAMARHLGETRPFVGVQARGVDGVRTPDPSIDAMADRYVRELVAARPEGPYLLGGYSGGGLVAVEMARRLTARGASVPAVLLFDSYPPGQDEPGPLGKLVNVARNTVRHGPGPVLRSLAVILRRRLSGRVVANPADLGYGDVSDRGLARIDVHFNQAAARHRVTPVDVHAVVLGAEIIQASLPPRRDWSMLLTRPPALRTVPGHHYSMFDTAHAGALAAAVEDVLAEVAP